LTTVVNRNVVPWLYDITQISGLTQAAATWTAPAIHSINSANRFPMARVHLNSLLARQG